MGACTTGGTCRSVKSYGNGNEACGMILRSFRFKALGSYDLVIYQAGADMHVDDPLGGIMTTDEMRQRDDLVP